MLVQDFVAEFAKYRQTAEKAMAQVADDAINRIVSNDGNSIAMLVRHIGGNLVSRFTDFLTTDGEKPWRDRDGEFTNGPFSRAEMDDAWRAGWTVLERELASLGDDDLTRTVSIRGQPLTVHAALVRSLSHMAMHIGQIILLARILATGEWQTLSIPKGQSKQYNQQLAAEQAGSR
jgi:hypothetical protein